MYNEELKKDYLNNGIGSKNVVDFRAVANAAANMETEFDRDLAYFTREEVIQLINSLELTNPLTVKGYLSAIRNYQMVYSSNTELDENPIRKEEIDIVSGIKKCFYDSYHSLKCSLEKGMSFTDGYAEPAALTLAWIGIPFYEACRLQTSQVDLMNGVIARYPQRDIVFGNDEPEALKILRAYANTSKSYRTRNCTYEVYQPKNNPYFLHAMVSKGSIDKVAKPIAQSNLTSSFAKLAVKVKEQNDSVNYNYTDILRSGELHRIYVAEQNGLAVTSKINEERVCSMISGKMPYYELMYQYKKYKQAFNLH
jgi:hypothetical protein